MPFWMRLQRAKKKYFCPACSFPKKQKQGKKINEARKLRQSTREGLLLSIMPWFGENSAFFLIFRSHCCLKSLEEKEDFSCTQVWKPNLQKTGFHPTQQKRIQILLNQFVITASVEKNKFLSINIVFENVDIAFSFSLSTSFKSINESKSKKTFMHEFKPLLSFFAFSFWLCISVFELYSKIWKN